MKAFNYALCSPATWLLACDPFEFGVFTSSFELGHSLVYPIAITEYHLFL
jgi:hypothetical protein